MKIINITSDFKDDYPVIAPYLDFVFATSREFYMYNEGVTIEEAFKSALVKDPTVKSYKMRPLCDIAGWLEYFLCADTMTSDQRILFYKDTLGKKEYGPLRAVLEDNKLLRNPMNNIRELLIGDVQNHALIIHSNNRKCLEDMVKDITPSNGDTLQSEYDIFSNAEKLNYVTTFAGIIRSICLDYIYSKSKQ